jgi:hypothetical protein
MFTQDKITMAVAEAYKNMIQRPNIAHIYCDMDGVLVDFEKGALKALNAGKEPLDVALKKPDAKKKIADTNGFWENLEQMPDAMKLWNFINRYEPRILTAYPTWDEGGKHGKKIWVDKHLKLPHDRFFPVKRIEKQDYAKDTKTGMPNLLIDDHKKNIQEFEAAGGIGVLHINANDTISKLKKLGFR